MPNRERIIIEDDEYGRLTVQREPAPELVFAGTGPGRGLYEDQVRAANDVEYIPPPGSRAA